jgi:glycosyltransferase involved in cell wall biosynthesis
MKSIKLSVALCTYNGERFLSEQLRSIETQTRQPDEIVICDDCSTDRTRTILREVSARAPFPVRLLQNSQNLGSTKSFERAISACAGDVIVLSDQDDSWYDDKLQVTEDLLLRHPDAGAIFGDADLVDENLDPLGYHLRQTTYFGPALRRQFENGKAFEALLTHNVVTGATMAFWSKYRDIVIPIPAQWIHDGWIAIVISSSANVIYADRPLIKYRQHSAQQLGAAKPSIARHFANTQASTNQEKYRGMPELYQLVYERLKEKVKLDLPQRSEELLREKIRHMGARAELSADHLRRVPTIAREFALNRYGRFGYGWKGAVRDLLVNLEK